MPSQPTVRAATTRVLRAGRSGSGRHPAGGGPDDAEPAITLGLLPDGDEVNVSIGVIHASEGWLQTYVVEFVQGEWTITGTDAPSGLT